MIGADQSSSPVSDQAQAFLNEINHTSELWSSIDIRTVAVRVGTAWVNLRTRCLLRGADVAEVPRVPALPQTKTVCCLQEVRPVSELRAILNAIESGVLRVSEEDVHLFGRDPAPPQSSAYFQPETTYALPPTAPYRKSHVYSFSESSVSNVLSQVPGYAQRIDRELRALEHPWDGMDSISPNFFGLSDRLDGRSLTVEVVAPLEARIEDCVLSGEALGFRIEVGRLPLVSQCSVGLFGMRKSGIPISQTQRFSASEWQPERDGSVHRLEKIVQVDDALWVTLLLRIGPSVVDSTKASNLAGVGANPRMTAYEALDQQDWFSHYLLDPQPTEQHDFHRAVARLFGFAGFLVDSFAGEKKLEGSGIVDFLAHGPSTQTLFVVECTTGQLASKTGKLGTLVTRTGQVRQALEAVSAIEVVPVMVTALSDVPGYELDDAATDGVAVLMKHHLVELLSMAKRQTPLGEIVAWCRGMVPPRNEGAVEQVFGRR